MGNWLELRRAKVVLSVLAMLLFAVCIASGLCALYMAEQWYYHPDTGDFYDSAAVYRITARKAEEAAVLWRRAIDHLPDTEAVIEPDSTNFGYRILDGLDDGRLYSSNLRGDLSYREIGSFAHDEVWVQSFVRAPLDVQDDYWRAAQVFDALYPHRWTAVIVLGAAFVLLVVDLLLLCSAAGRRRGVEGVALGLLEHIPLDLYLLVAGAACLLLVYGAFGELLGWWTVSLGEYVLAGALLFVCGAVLVATLQTLAVRYKAGKWWRNTLLYRLVRPLWEMVTTLFWSLPLIWQVVLGALGVEAVSLLLIVLAIDSNSAAPLMLYCLIHAALFLAMAFAALGLQRLKAMGERIADGELDYRPDLRWMPDSFRRHAETLGRIGEGLNAAVTQRMRSERFKTELITNVSHDIKTPLTSIVNYVDLLDKLELDGEAGQYVAVLGRQTARLKKLTEDLVEASKATTGNLEVHLERTGLGELLHQSVAEYADRLAARELEPVLELPEEELHVLADGRHLWRVMDNLLGNVCKYAQPGTRVYIELSGVGGECAVAVKNISRARLNIDADELMERFVRGDGARSSEGSGLGLHIARSLVELQRGRLVLTVDGDLFKAQVYLPAAPEPDPDPARDAPPAGTEQENWSMERE